MERMENDRITKRVYVGECAGSRSGGSHLIKEEKRFGCQASNENGAG